MARSVAAAFSSSSSCARGLPSCRTKPQQAEGSGPRQGLPKSTGNQGWTWHCEAEAGSLARTVRTKAHTAAPKKPCLGTEPGMMLQCAGAGVEEMVTIACGNHGNHVTGTEKPLYQGFSRASQPD